MSELRLPGSGTVDIGHGFLLVYQGSPPGAARAWRDDGSRALGKPSGRVLSISGRWHLVSVYAPTMQRPESEKDGFWDDLQSVWDTLPSREPAWILGDLNARVGINSPASPSPAADGVHGPFENLAWVKGAAMENVSSIFVRKTI